MAAEVWVLGGHHDDVADASGDLVVTAWTEVGLGRLIGIDPPNLEVVVVHSAEQRPRQRDEDDDKCRSDEKRVGWPAALLAGRVEPHRRSFPHVETLIVERSEGVVSVTLNRPEKKNAANDRMWDELQITLDEVARSADDRVLVITGAGGAFCSGADLSPGDVSDEGVARMRRIGNVALALHRLPKPTIAKVRGVAAGAGCNLALGCDLIVAGDDARFIEIFSKRGLSLDFGGSWLLPRLIGLHKAKELAFFADAVSAEEAERIGLVNRVVADAELDAFVDGWAARLAAGPPLAMGMSKQMLNQSYVLSMEQALDNEGRAQTVNFGTKDFVEAVSAFLQKRDPKFTGS